MISWSFIGLYGWIRFGLMYLREEEQVWNGLTLSQIFSGLMGVLGTTMLLILLVRHRTRSERAS